MTTLEIGLVSEGPSLSLLELMLAHLYIPLLEGGGVRAPGGGGGATAGWDSHGSDTLRSELLLNLAKFAGQVGNAVQLLTGDIHITVPALNQEQLDRSADDYEVLSVLESAMAEWALVLDSVVARETAKATRGKGPLAEIDFWRERNAALSGIFEQLNSPHVRKMIEVIDKCSTDANLLIGFRSHFAELSKLYAEAKDNVKFLTTLERHFKNISTGSMHAVLDTLPPMMNALRMVWIISRHYSDDTRMGNLFERIAGEIGDKVEAEVQVKVLFSMPPAEAVARVDLAKSVLEQWREVYLQIREKIETSGRDARWEFDRKRLFDRTDYMASICGDLRHVVRVVDDFHKFLGPELKAVTGDAQGIDEVIHRVNAMVDPIQNLSFDVFDKQSMARWAEVSAKFGQDKEQIERATRAFIDTSFKKLRSAEGALDLLRSFKSIKSEGAIGRQMMDKFSDILEQFSREIDHTREMFEANMEAPLISRNQPKVAGAIAWSRLLFGRIRKTMQNLTSSDYDMMSEAAGVRVQHKYTSLARAMMNFEKKLFGEWSERVNAIAMQHLKNNILRKVPGAARIVVSFHDDLTALIRETRYLDRMGFTIPETALNVTLQEDKYHTYVESLRGMLDHYHSVLDMLTAAEKKLLATRATKLERALDPGFNVLNWSSLGIPDFVTSCTKATNEFLQLVNQVQKNSTMIQQVVNDISEVHLVVEPPAGDDVMDLQEFYEFLEKNRLEVVDEMVRKYRTIAPLLGKVEEAVAGTNTRRSAQLKDYYGFWERAIFNALNAMVNNGISSLVHMFRSRNAKVARNLAIDVRPPLFKISALLNLPEIVVQPPMNEVAKFLNRLVRNLVESTRPFVRWMDGTCLETPEQRPNGEDEEPIVFTFYTDVASNPAIIKVSFTLNHTIQKTLHAVSRHIEGWRRHQSLWKQDKASILDKFAAKNPSCGEYEEKLSKYVKMAQDIGSHPGDKECDFIRVSSRALIASIRDEVLEWVRAIGQTMAKGDTLRLESIRQRIAPGGTLDRALHADPATLEDLKGVLNIIGEIRTSTMLTEIEYTDLEERYRTRALFNVSDNEEDATAALALRSQWAALTAESIRVDESLEDVKARFTDITVGQVRSFVSETVEFAERLRRSGPGIPTVDLDKGIAQLEDFKVELAQKMEVRDHLVQAERLFELPITSYPDLLASDQEVNNLGVVYGVYGEHLAAVESFASTLWAELNIEKLMASGEEFMNKMKKISRLVNMPVYGLVEARLKSFQDSLPLIHHLKNEALRPRHWEQLMTITNSSFSMDASSFTLQNLFSMELSKYSREISELTSSAMKELTIEAEIKKVAEVWKEQRFELFRYTKGTEDRGYILKSTEEITVLLEDMGLNLQSMMASRFVKPFMEEVRKWEGNLSLISEVIEMWMQVQRRWMYLESIFIGSDDIRHQLPEEAKRFDKIDKAWKKIMTETAKNTNVLDCCSVENRLSSMAELSEQLERCQKSLSEYLDTKRNAFPRFFFISDDELLSILGTSDPTSVQEHMLKLFDNCASLKFGRGNKTVIGMTSSEGESFDFRQPVPVEGAVESWMLQVESEMRSTLFFITKEAVFFYADQMRTKWISATIGMSCLVGSQIWWTWEVEDTFRAVHDGSKHGMKDLSVKLTRQLGDLTTMVRSNLSNLDRKKVNSLIILDVHARDIIDVFVRDSVMDHREFAWESQLRFLWDRAVDDILIRQCTGIFRFGYEYMGLNGRLVITALTDRCYMTLTTALTYRLGGAPAGPAGTGKTETVKDLAKSMALLCVVFNCGEGLDYKAMGSIFSGLVQCGAWGCFDEFNRIDAEVLSVVSSQIKQIQEALKNELTRFQFEGKEISCDARAGIFITMNPGYAGRTELPDNLKALFRPVTMVVPDLQQICEIMLFSEGFDSAKVLAKKMTVLYRLAREQLSKQYHYDFGLRALKSVLVMAGSLKRGAPDMSEDLVLMRALRDMNLPKFVFDDVPLFLGLINDLFPGLNCPRVRYPQLNDVVETELADHGYMVMTGPSEQVDKVIQLYETMLTRHTTMVVGQTGGGKTVIIQTLARAQTKMGAPTKLYVVNPKAQSVAELYGTLDPDTRDWTDGLLSNIFRELNRQLTAQQKDERRYVVFDGDVDAVWVENMNSVMDDNKLLTLPNGERIRLQNWCKLLFEVFDLQYASPATVSRCGMVYVDSKNLGYSPAVSKWLNSRPKEETDFLKPLIGKYLDKCINFVLEGVDGELLVKKPKQCVPLTNLNLSSQLCTMLELLMTEERKITDASVMESLFIYCIVWSVGAALVQNSLQPDRERFDKFVKLLSGLATNESENVPATSLPAASLYEYWFNIDEHVWVPWKSLVSDYVAPPDGKFAKIVVPTVDTVRSTWLLSTFAGGGRAVLFVGDSGTAKTVTIANYLGNLDQTKNIILNMSFSNRTTSMDVQRSVEDSVEKRTKDTYGPPMGKTLYLFIDDLNMPRVDLYGTQQPIALLKMLIERKGLYDRGKELNWKNLKGLQFVGAMGPPGGARNNVDPRFLSLFSIFEIQFPANESLMRIYDTILHSHLVKLPKEIGDACKDLTVTTLSLYNYILEKLPPTPSRFHYIFNLRDLGRIYEGLMLSTPDRFANIGDFIRLWRNECLRIFHDRLICQEDKDLVIMQIKTLVQEKYPKFADAALADPLLFGDYRYAMGDQEARVYEDLGDFSIIKTLFEEILVDYNKRMKPMRLVFFEDALEHLTRIHRQIRLERGNALLVGVGGSGKQSLSRMAAHTAGCSVFEITLSRGYDEIMFRDDLKKLYGMLGADNKRVMFLFTDSHVAHEGFLELINNMLTSGMVPALYAEDEKDALVGAVRDEVAKLGILDTKEACWNFFVNKCRDNLVRAVLSCWERGLFPVFCQLALHAERERTVVPRGCSCPPFLKARPRLACFLR